MTEPTNMERTAPDVIYLNVGPDIEPEHTFNDLEEVTWCSESIDEHDITYVKQGSAKIWYVRYRDACQKHNDHVAQLGAQIEALEHEVAMFLEDAK